MKTHWFPLRTPGFFGAVVSWEGVALKGGFFKAFALAHLPHQELFEEAGLVVATGI